MLLVAVTLVVVERGITVNNGLVDSKLDGEMERLLVYSCACISR